MWAAAMGRMHLVSGWCGRGGTEDESEMASQEQGRAMGECLRRDRACQTAVFPNCSTINTRSERPGGRKNVLAGLVTRSAGLCLPQHGEGCGRQRGSLPVVADTWSLPGPSHSFRPSVMH